MEIFSINGICGSGKTEILVNKIAREAFSSLFVVAQPTKDLLNETAKRIQDINPDVPLWVIHGDTHARPKHEFLEQVRAANGNGCILITHALLNMLGHDFHGKNDIELYIDEIPNICITETGNYRYSFQKILAEILDVEEVTDAEGNVISQKFYRLVNKDPEKLKTYIKNTDTIYEVIKPVLRLLDDENMVLEVKQVEWDRFQNYKKYKRITDSNHGPMSFYGVRKPSFLDGFKQVSIMGANFDKSFLYQIWTQMDVKFIPHPTFKLNTVHENSNNISVYYLTEKHSSRHLLSQIDIFDPFKNIKKDVLDLFNNEDFIYITNNRYKDPFSKERMPFIVHGRNDWLEYRNVAILGAVNPSPPYYEWLRSRFNMTSSQIDRALYFEVAYQAIMRTAIRVNSTEDIRILVIDKKLADFLVGDIFPGSKMFELSNNDSILSSKPKKKGRKPKVVSDLSITPAERGEKRLSKVDELKKIKETLSEITSFDNTSTIGFTTEGSISSKTLLPGTGTWGDLKTLFKESYEIKFKSKEENYLISGAIFNKEATDTLKGLSNISHINFMMLDLDDSYVNPLEFYSILPNVKWLLYNSHSNVSRPGQYRYRVMIPFDRPVSNDEYKAIFDVIAEKIESAGFNVRTKNRDYKDSGLDLSKRTPNSFFYLPCWPSSGKKTDRIWLENWEMKLLQTEDYIASYKDPMEDLIMLDDFRKEPRILNDEEARAFKEKALADWRLASKGTGNIEFFRLGLKLKKAGLQLGEIFSTLQEQAMIANSPSERKKQIPSIIKSLTKGML